MNNSIAEKKTIAFCQAWIDDIGKAYNLPYTLPKESDIILAFVLDKSISFIQMNPSYLVHASQWQRIEAYMQRRKMQEPLAYILGEAAFRELILKVNKQVLIPRPETELLVQAALDIFNTKQEINVLEIGTGSGAIALSLAYERKNTTVTAIDIDVNALACAQENYHKYKKQIIANHSSILWLESNLLDQIEPKQQFDLCITNPPYIKTGDIQTLDVSVKKFEPWKALDGGGDGLYFYEQLASSLQGYLKENGYYMLEQGFDQTKSIQSKMRSFSWQYVNTIQDLTNCDRIQIYRNKLC